MANFFGESEKISVGTVNGAATILGVHGNQLIAVIIADRGVVG